LKLWPGRAQVGLDEIEGGLSGEGRVHVFVGLQLDHRAAAAGLGPGAGLVLQSVQQEAVGDVRQLGEDDGVAELLGEISVEPEPGDVRGHGAQALHRGQDVARHGA
jgi:hypothetical protein